ncbi:MAG: hypothetical protein E7161_04775 [Firmicutes bacterium]|nr:hypothetical protein [Bacillota bacterium]
MLNLKAELKMSLLQLRQAINLEKQTWINRYTTNCYAYALGLDVPQNDIIDKAYIPGTMSGTGIKLDDNYIFTYNDLITNIYGDLDFLGISFREVSISEQLNEEEWKIAIFTSKCADYIEDIHFLRLRKDGFWYHKNGWIFNPSPFDDDEKIIMNPQTCSLCNKDFHQCLSLRLK